MLRTYAAFLAGANRMRWPRFLAANATGAITWAGACTLTAYLAGDTLQQLARPGFHQPYGRFWLAFWNVPAIARELLPQGHWTSGGPASTPRTCGSCTCCWCSRWHCCRCSGICVARTGCG